MMKHLINIALYVFVFLVLSASLRGVSGNPAKTDMNSSYWKDAGPFELSPERGRFALTFSLAEDESFQFDLPVARFALPDLGYIDGKYVSLFAPGVSFLVLPGYLLGKIFKVAQVGSFAAISFFAVLNVVLIEKIARKLGVKTIYSIIAALAFIFSTPAFTYAVSLYQHHISVFLLLAGIWVYLNFEGALSTWIIWFLVALSVPVDFPNFFMMAPLMLVAALRFFEVVSNKEIFQVKFKYAKILSVSGVILPIMFLGWVNYKSYNDPLRLAGTVTNVRTINEQGLPDKEKPTASTVLDEYRSGDRESSSVALGFFDTRNISNGLFIHFLSPDRGVIFYAPVVIFSLVGAFILYRRNSRVLALLMAISLINIFIYSMWGDPWGGWAFGSRYLIPFYACSSIMLGVGLEKIFKKKYLKPLVLLVVVYSIFVNSLGAITTNANPPKIEVSALEELSGREEKYTYERNWDFLKTQGTKSFIYNNYLKTIIAPTEFYFLLTITISILITSLFIYDLTFNKNLNRSLKRNKVVRVSNVLVGQKYFPSPFRKKMKALGDYITINWNRKLSLWKSR